MKPKTPNTGTTSTTATSTEAADNSAKAEPSTEADAVALLKADHRKVEQMFARLATLEGAAEKLELVRQVGNALVIHSLLEEEIFYPACREHGVDDALMDEAQVEHDAVGLLVGELLQSRPQGQYYDAKLKVLGEYVKLHVREEERSSTGIFAKAAAAGLDMAGLGKRLQARKQELEQQAQADGVIPPTSRSLGELRHSDYGEMNMARYNQERDEQGRFVSDDDRRHGGSRSRDDYDDRGRYSRSRDDDERSSRYSHGGWYGDPEGHSRASERGWDGRRDDDDRGGRYSRSRDDDYGRYSRQGSQGGHGGWFGDPEGHARAAERGWETRRDDDDDRGRRQGSRGR